MERTQGCARHGQRARIGLLSGLLLALLPVLAAPVLAQQDSNQEQIEIVAEGMAALNGDVAAAEEEAVWDAKRNAVEQAAGILVRSRSVGRDFTLDEDEIQGSTQGFIRSWQK